MLTDYGYMQCRKTTIIIKYNRMKAKDYFEEKKPNMRELWNLSDTQKETIYSLMEKYAALRIHDVVGQSEKLVCPECSSNRILEYKDKNQCRLCWYTWAN